MYEIKKENYDELQACFENLLDLLRNFNRTRIDREIYAIAYFLGGDYKILRVNFFNINIIASLLNNSAFFLIVY